MNQIERLFYLFIFLCQGTLIYCVKFDKISRYLNIFDGKEDYMKHKESHELLALLENCGHFLHHRRGGKRGQGKILRILVKEGEMTQRELQDCLGIQPGSMSEIIMKLEGNGLICRTKDETDRRKIKVKITEEGRSFYQEKHKENIEQEKKLFDVLTVKEQEQLKVLLSKLFEDWESSFEKSLFQHRKGCHKKHVD